MKFTIISDRKAITSQLLFSLSVLEFMFKFIFTSKIPSQALVVIIGGGIEADITVTPLAPDKFFFQIHLEPVYDP